MTWTEFVWLVSTYFTVIAVLAFYSRRREWAGNVAATLLCAPVVLIHVPLFALDGLKLLWWPLWLRYEGADISLGSWMFYVADMSLLAWAVSVPVRLTMAGWRRWRRRGEIAEPIGDGLSAPADEPRD